MYETPLPMLVPCMAPMQYMLADAADAPREPKRSVAERIVAYEVSKGSRGSCC